MKLTKNDFLKGLIVAVLTTIAARILPVVDAESLPNLTDIVNCAKVGLAAGISYLIKNALTILTTKA